MRLTTMAWERIHLISRRICKVQCIASQLLNVINVASVRSLPARDVPGASPHLTSPHSPGELPWFPILHANKRLHS
jgi:hypothetical protein